MKHNSLSQLSTTVSVRAKTSQAVTNVAVQSGEPTSAVWQRIYTRLETAFGIRIEQYPRRKGESLVSVAERHGLIDKLYALAYAEYLYIQSYEE